MKNVLILFCCLLTFSGIYAQENKVKISPVNGDKVSLFSLKDVRLLDSDFKHIMDLNHEYLLSLEPDRLLSWFRREAGLTPKAQPYPFWESEWMGGHGPLPGHIMGFYLSGISMMYASTGDAAILDRLQYILKELSRCQQAGGDGYLLPTINGRAVFENVLKGDFKTSNPFIETPHDLTWEPVYVMNKIMLGLYQVYMRCDLVQAKEILVRMADWFGYAVLDKLSHEDIQKLLVCEHGSINESFINVYEVTGGEKYLKWAQMLNDEDMWVPMAEGKDILQGWHANTQIPKFTGFESVYRYDDNEKFTKAARFFWETVVNKHTWVMGGNSTGEHFFAPEEFERRIELNGGPESCNSVNMLRLTERLYCDYGEVEKVDYYEKVLFNHILANYDPDQGMCTYYTSMKPGHYKIYGTPYDSFWCCTGTGFEQTSKFGQMIYAHTDDDLYVNMFIPSVVSWKEGVQVRQETSFPDESATHLIISGNSQFKLKVRCPYWVGTSSLTVKINGKQQKLNSGGDGYISIDRQWKDGDRIDISLPMKIEVVPLNEATNYLAFKYGPIVLAAEIADDQLRKEDFRSARSTIAWKNYLVLKVPAFFGNSQRIASAITRNKEERLAFSCSNGKVVSQPVELVPFNRIHWSRYAVYFRHYDRKELYWQAYKEQDELEAKLRKEEQELDARTVDRVIIANQESEKAHKMEAVFSSSGRDWRDASKGGYFMYELKVLPGVKQLLCLQLLGSDAGNRIFDVLIDGKPIQTINLFTPNPEHTGLYRRYIDIPDNCIGQKKAVTVKFQAKNGGMAGGIFDVRILSANSLGWRPAEAAIMTPWGEQIVPEHVLEEYPRPQMQRGEWMNLNGLWDFTKGVHNDTYDAKREFERKILVPFPVESALSGIMEVDANNADKNYWYRRTFTLPENYKGKDLLLHFGAVDWECEVYVNGKKVGVHEGGYDAFGFNITPYLRKNAQQELAVKVSDSQWAGGHPHGKQSLNPNGIWYTPVTGIWQTVWLEPVSKNYLSDFLIIPDIDKEQIKVTLTPNAVSGNMSAVIRLLADNREVAITEVSSFGKEIYLPVKNPRLWSPDSPFLYDVEIELQKGGKTVDCVKSYVGMRKIALEKKDGKPCIYLNNQPLFQYGVLDQGWWPDGLYTAPSDEALEFDIRKTKEMGFNMIRKHVKVEPARWYYHCDRLGMLVWQDIPNATTNTDRNEWVETNFVREAHNIMGNLKNVPSIITWVVFNEGWGQYDRKEFEGKREAYTRMAVQKVQERSNGRLVNAASGWFDYEIGDMIDKHHYPLPAVYDNSENHRAVACGEYGGINLKIDNHIWAGSEVNYTTVDNAEALKNLFIEYAGKVKELKEQKGLCAAVYTQITDVESEINGLITYDRKVIKWNERQLKEVQEVLKNIRVMK